MVKQRERKNLEMATIIAGMKRQINEDGRSIASDVK